MTLVYSNLKKRYFALKAVAKAHIIETGQEEFLLNEKKVRGLNLGPVLWERPLVHFWSSLR